MSQCQNPGLASPSTREVELPELDPIYLHDQEYEGIAGNPVQMKGFRSGLE